MPGRDGTGPQGAGPLTGGRRGPCATATGVPRGAGQGYAPRGGGRGRAFGGGRGQGFGGRSQANTSMQALKNRADDLERELKEVRRRLDAVS